MAILPQEQKDSAMRMVLWALLPVFLLVAGCKPPKSPAPEAEPPAAMEKRVEVELAESTDPATALPPELRACIGQKYALAFNMPRKGTVALYLSRFYRHTDAFDKARRCDSFVLRHNPAVVPGQADWYQVVVFSYDDGKQVERIRKLEPSDDGGFRTPAKNGEAGGLNFKVAEGYRVFFQENRIIFFFFDGLRQEDPELAAAARELLDTCFAPAGLK